MLSISTPASAHAVRFLRDDSIRTCAIHAVGKKKRINGKGREGGGGNEKEGDRRLGRQGDYAPVLWGDEALIFGLDFRIDLSAAAIIISDSCHRGVDGSWENGGSEGEGNRMGRKISRTYVPQGGWRWDTVRDREAETCWARKGLCVRTLIVW